MLEYLEMSCEVKRSLDIGLRKTAKENEEKKETLIHFTLK